MKDRVVGTIGRRVAGGALLLLLLATLPQFGVQAKGEPQTFPQTGKTIQGTFALYWEQHGGLDTLGYPVSDELQEQLDDGQVYRVQYFERAVLVWHPENAWPRDVVPLDLGMLRYQAKYGAGASESHPANGHSAPARPAPGGDR